MKTRRQPHGRHDQDGGKGAVEGDRPEDPVQQGTENAGALDGNGLPADANAICEDALGANVDQNGRHDGAAGAAEDATETGETGTRGTTER